MSKATAKAYLDSFKSKQVAGRWPHIQKGALLAGLAARVDNPNLIRQAGTPLCGPASFIRTIALDDPDTYVRVGMDLFIKGETRIRNMAIKPSNSVLQSKVLGGTDPSDWIMLASIRDSDNWFFSTAGWFGLNLAGITLPGSLKDWFSASGYTDIVASTYLATVTKPIPTVVALEMQKASHLFSSNYKVALFINADVLSSADQDSIALVPNHWVVLTSPIADRGTVSYEGPISLSVFTWGRTMNIPVSPSKPLSKRNFMDHYFGFVAARL